MEKLNITKLEAEWEALVASETKRLQASPVCDETALWRLGNAVNECRKELDGAFESYRKNYAKRSKNNDGFILARFAADQTFKHSCDTIRALVDKLIRT